MIFIKRSDEYREACSLAMSLFNKYYKEDSVIELLEDTAGVITQIDNMVAGLGMDLETANARNLILREALIGIDYAVSNHYVDTPEFSVAADEVRKVLSATETKA